MIDETLLRDLRRSLAAGYSGPDNMVRRALAELERLTAELERVCRLAGDALGTDPSLCNSGCVQALADYSQAQRLELDYLAARCRWLEEMLGTLGM